MKLKSCTYQSTDPWGDLVKKDLNEKIDSFLLSLKEGSGSIMGILQSFTFPENFADEHAEDMAHSLYDIYRKHQSVLLGGDTSGGPSLVITVVALLK